MRPAFPQSRSARAVLPHAAATVSTSRPSSLTFDLQVIGHGEHAWHTISPNVNDVFIRLICHHSIERDVSVFYADLNRRYGAKSITGRQQRFSINGPVLGHSDLVVHCREGQHFNLIDNAFD